MEPDEKACKAMAVALGLDAYMSTSDPNESDSSTETESWYGSAIRSNNAVRGDSDSKEVQKDVSEKHESCAAASHCEARSTLELSREVQVPKDEHEIQKSSAAASHSEAGRTLKLSREVKVPNDVYETRVSSDSALHTDTSASLGSSIDEEKRDQDDGAVQETVHVGTQNLPIDIDSSTIDSTDTSNSEAPRNLQQMKQLKAVCNDDKSSASHSEESPFDSPLKNMKQPEEAVPISYPKESKGDPESCNEHGKSSVLDSEGPTLDSPDFDLDLSCIIFTFPYREAEWNVARNVNVEQYISKKTWLTSLKSMITFKQNKPFLPFCIAMRSSTYQEVKMSYSKAFLSLQPQQLNRIDMDCLIDFYLLWIQRDCPLSKDFATFPTGFYPSIMKILTDEAKMKKTKKKPIGYCSRYHFYPDLADGKKFNDPSKCKCICIPIIENSVDTTYYSCGFLADMNSSKKRLKILVVDGKDRGPKELDGLYENLRIIASLLKGSDIDRTTTRYVSTNLVVPDAYSGPFRLMMSIHVTLGKIYESDLRIKRDKDICRLEEEMRFSTPAVLSFQKELTHLLKLLGKFSSDYKLVDDEEKGILNYRRTQSSEKARSHDIPIENASISIDSNQKIEASPTTEDAVAVNGRKENSPKNVHRNGNHRRRLLPIANTKQRIKAPAKKKPPPTNTRAKASANEKPPTSGKKKPPPTNTRAKAANEKPPTSGKKKSPPTSKEAKRAFKAGHASPAISGRVTRSATRRTAASSLDATKRKTRSGRQMSSPTPKKRKCSTQTRQVKTKKSSSRRRVSAPPKSQNEIKDVTTRRVASTAVKKVQTLCKLVTPLKKKYREKFASVEPVLLVRDEMVEKPGSVKDTFYFRDKTRWNVLCPAHTSKEALVVRLEELIQTLKGKESETSLTFTNDSAVLLGSLFGCDAEDDGKLEDDISQCSSSDIE